MKIRVSGIRDGNYEINISENAEKIPYIFPEFFGIIEVNGMLKKVGNRFSFNGSANCNAKLICDISLEEYIEKITADISIQFTANTALYFIQKERNIIEPDEEIAIREDDEFFDLAEEVKDALAVGLPMKRLAPNYRDKSFAEYFPQYSAANQKNIDDRWEKLKTFSSDD